MKTKVFANPGTYVTLVILALSFIMMLAMVKSM
jgi:hypothetical protein